MQRVESKNKTGFEHEYRSIHHSIALAPGFEELFTPQTKYTTAKNRYRDVLPFEKTRVRLENPTNAPNGDYINANYVDETYIACIAPVPPAICDFWHMVWQCDVHVILMLTNFVERERIKADMYWDSRGQIVDFGGVFVQLLGEEPHPASLGFIVRKFKMWTAATTEARARVVQHVQLTTWPDHGVLTDFRVIAPMLDLVNSYREAAARAHGGPARMIVHCSAGIGRSGTFIAIDVILKRLEAALSLWRNALAADGDVDAAIAHGAEMLREALDVAKLVHRLRTQRDGMVQTLEQYVMIHDYVAALLDDRQPW
ncbi:hypothetical protein ATCC90586_003032 [Pythium insidiosum]|nr:hypothetical protein ATCC90586_003032 [Pythium insidiosum]